MMVLLASVLPPLSILGFIILLDEYEKEPFSYILKAFFSGIAIIPFILIFEIYLSNVFTSDFYEAFIGIALVEEGFKFLPFYLIFLRDKYTNEPFDAVVYALCVGTGFSTVENIGYIYDSVSTTESLEIGVMRALTAIPLHASAGILMASPYVFNFENRNKFSFVVFSIFPATFLHGLYDYFLIKEDPNFLLAILVLMLGLITARLIVRQSFAQSKLFWSLERTKNPSGVKHDVKLISKYLFETFSLTNKLLTKSVIILIALMFTLSFHGSLSFTYLVASCLGISIVVFSTSLFLGMATTLFTRRHFKINYDDFIFPVSLVFLTIQAVVTIG